MRYLLTFNKYIFIQHLYDNVLKKPFSYVLVQNN